MSWFKGKQEQTIRLPFPPDRLAIVGSVIIPAAIERAVRLRQKSCLTADDVWISSFLNSYVCSFPRKLDESDTKLGAAVRFSLLRTTLAKSDAEAQFRFDSFSASFEQRDEETIQAFHIGSEDGSAYFDALMQGVAADDRSTTNLILAIRALDRLEPFRIPARFQI